MSETALWRECIRELRLQLVDQPRSEQTLQAELMCSALADLVDEVEYLRSMLHLLESMVEIDLTPGT